MILSLQTLLDGIVDYAGLFPPAQLPMEQAVREYATYLNDPQRSILARFVVPVARLGEFEMALEEISRQTAQPAASTGNGSAPLKQQPWYLAALVGPDVADDFYRILKFNERYSHALNGPRAIIDVVELRAATPDAISETMHVLPKGIQAYIEIPAEPNPLPLIRAIQQSGGRAKIRTGGVTADAFPKAEIIARFILACRDLGVAFKATAGLHHPLRAEYRLTYEPNPPMGMMYGYLNIFGAAVLAWSGAPESLVLQMLQETDITTLSFDATGFHYHGHTVSSSQIRDVRGDFAISFGSCSFREPVDDLAALGFIN